MKKLLYLLPVLFSLSFFGQQAYYNDVNLKLTGVTLKQELANKITNTHSRFLFYEQIWNACKITDANPNNNQEVLLIYGWENGTDTDIKNDRTRSINSNGGINGQWNREHVYSQSLGTPTLGESGPGADAHHLRPVDSQTNSSRGNRFFGNGTGNSGSTSQTYIDPIDNTTSSAWYPGDEWKGDVARMMMYMYVRYGDRCLPTNIGLGNSANTPDAMIDLFLQWNVEDPVSDFERQRNEYHGNTNNQFAQGNRNPFIDNPILATRIWGGTKAEDSWGIYSGNDTQAPTTPINLITSNITTKSVVLTWSAATDNVEVSSYDVFLNGNLLVNTTNTSVNISDLFPNTNYALTVIAKDIVDNKSVESSIANFSTLEDTEAPSIPTNITISNQTTNSFIVSWDAATDNTKVLNYDVFVDGILNTTTTALTHTVTNLNLATSYNVQILARDVVNLTSALSNIVVATTNGNNATATELFFSEYIEGTSNNKALEIVNLTGNTVDLSAYTIKKQSNGGKNGNGWDETFTLNLAGYSLNTNDVFVIINGSASIQKLIDEADYVHPNNNTNEFGSPINYNGNDPVGLFKNDVLIDVIGTFNGGDANFAQNRTLRRKTEILSPNTNFNITNEWDVFGTGSTTDDVSDFGTHSAIVLSIDNFEMGSFSIYPIPVSNHLVIQNNNHTEISEIIIFSTLGKKVFETKNIHTNIDVSYLQKGLYILVIKNNKKTKSIKFIKN